MSTPISCLMIRSTTVEMKLVARRILAGIATAIAILMMAPILEVTGAAQIS